MAVIVITANTEDKTVAVTIDGVSVPDVEDASLYTYRDSDGNVNELSVSVYTVTKKENGVTKRVSYYAMGSEKATLALASGQTVYNDVEGFVGIEEEDLANTQAARDIDHFLSSQKRPV